MKNLIVVLYILFSFSFCLGQDVIVLRINESELKCRIYVLNDSIISYRLWKSPDTSSYTLKKYEVLSYTLDKKPVGRIDVLPVPNGIGVTYSTVKSKKKRFSKNPSSEKDADLLGIYRSGELVEGYIINNNGDTINGYIKISNVALNQVNVNFTDTNKTKSLFTPADLRGYGYHQVHYEKKKVYTGKVTNGQRVKDGHLFLHRVVKGPAILYRFFTLFHPASAVAQDNQQPYYLGKLKQYFFIINPDNKSILTKGRSLKASLFRIFSGDKVIFEKLNYLGNDEIDVPQIVQDYNSRFENR